MEYLVLETPDPDFKPNEPVTEKPSTEENELKFPEPGNLGTGNPATGNPPLLNINRINNNKTAADDKAFPDEHSPKAAAAINFQNIEILLEN